MWWWFWRDYQGVVKENEKQNKTKLCVGWSRGEGRGMSLGILYPVLKSSAQLRNTLRRGLEYSIAGEKKGAERMCAGIGLTGHPSTDKLLTVLHSRFELVIQRFSRCESEGSNVTHGFISPLFAECSVEETVSTGKHPWGTGVRLYYWPPSPLSLTQGRWDGLWGIFF